MFRSILVGTDGSWAVDEAIALAAHAGARLLIVSAYEPVSGLRLREERQVLPADTQWMVNPREDVLALLETGRAAAVDAGVSEVETFAPQGDAADAIIVRTS